MEKEIKNKSKGMEKVIKRLAFGIAGIALLLVIGSISNKNQKSNNSPNSSKNGTGVNGSTKTGSGGEIEDIFSQNKTEDPSSPSSVSSLSITLNDKTDLATEVPNHFSRVKKELQKVSFFSPANEPIRLWDALQKAKVYFPDSVSKDIEVLAFYIYWGTNDIAPSEAILIKNNKMATQNASLIGEWEKEMVMDLKKFVLIGEKYDIVKVSGKKEFTTSSHFKNSRFINFSQDGAVSLNYTVADNLIIITNSMSVQEEMIKEFVGDLNKKSTP
jgi:hypothetical protein